MVQWIAFVLGSVILIAISWKSLHHPDSHGFYRFFAWEAILGLVIVNLPQWFSHWLAWYQIISWILLFGCLVPLIFGVGSIQEYFGFDLIKAKYFYSLSILDLLLDLLSLDRPWIKS